MSQKRSGTVLNESGNVEGYTTRDGIFMTGNPAAQGEQRNRDQLGAEDRATRAKMGANQRARQERIAQRAEAIRARGHGGMERG